MKGQSCEGGITRAIEQSLYAQMQGAEDLERKARETLSQAQKAYASAHKVFVGARSEWLNAFDQLEAQNPAPIRAFAIGGVR